MGQFVAKMGHKAICKDFSNIMMIVMMVAGNCNVENKFREEKGSFLDLMRYAYCWVWTVPC